MRRTQNDMALTMAIDCRASGNSAASRSRWVQHRCERWRGGGSNGASPPRSRHSPLHGRRSDPRGGIRHVIPAKGNYLAQPSCRQRSAYLVTGGDDPLLPHIISQLSTADRADIVVSFALESGVDRVFQHFRDLLERGGRLRILTGDYLGITEPNALDASPRPGGQRRASGV